jgi:urease accessory protein UreE
MGNRHAADQAYERAMGLETDAAVREFLQQQRLALVTADPPDPMVRYDEPPSSQERPWPGPTSPSGKTAT